MKTVDLAITNAQLWTPSRTANSALAAKSGRIVAIGSDAEILALSGPATEHVDAGGVALLPGFHDAHIHAMAAGQSLLGCDLETEHSYEGYRRLIHEHTQRHPNDEWFIGSGWFGDVFDGGLPHRRQLDDLIPDRPAILTSHDGHGVWVNSRTLEIGGITDDTADPAAGRIIRDADGVATGVLMDAAGNLVARLLPGPSPENLRRALLAAQDHLFSVGVTAWHDALLGAHLTFTDPLPTYIATLADGSLRARVTGSIWWPPHEGPDHVPEMLGRIRAARDARFAVRSVKIMQDGICENCTAALLEPYTDVHPSTNGDSVVAPADLAAIVTALDAADTSVHFHGVGDRAVRECLDAIAAARASRADGPRHQIAHLDVADPVDFPRFPELRTTANLQALWARDDQEIVERKYPLIGKERAARHFPFGSLHRAGAHLAMGSDWPVTSANPLWALHTACMRTAPSADAHARNEEARRTAQPDECLDVDTVVRAYTLGSAEIAGNDDEIGSIAVGKLADLVLLSGPIEGPLSFDRLHVDHTYLGGDAVYSR